MLHVCLTLSNDVYVVLPSIRLHLRIQFWQVTPAGSLALNDISLDGITGTSTSSVSGIYSWMSWTQASFSFFDESLRTQRETWMDPIRASLTRADTCTSLPSVYRVTYEYCFTGFPRGPQYPHGTPCNIKPDVVKQSTFLVSILPVNFERRYYYNDILRWKLINDALVFLQLSLFYCVGLWDFSDKHL